MIIFRYLTREVLSTCFIVTGALILAFLGQQLVRYLNYVAVGKIPTSLLLTLVSFEIPYLLALLLPLGLYLGVILAFGRLYADQEMSILNMAGFSRQKLSRLVFLIGLVISFIVLFLMLSINPWISAKRQQLMESDEATLHMIQTLIPGRFQASPDGKMVMYVEKISRDRERAENVFLAQEIQEPTMEKNSSWMLILADEGYQSKDPASSDPFFTTTDGYRYEGTPGQNDYKIIQFRKYQIRIPQGDMRIIHPEDEALPSIELWQHYANPNDAAELQWRISIAISVLLLGILAVPLSAIRPRQSRYLTLLPAMLIYIVYVNLLFVARRGVEQATLPISLGMWWVHGLLFILILIILYRRSRSWE